MRVTELVSRVNSKGQSYSADEILESLESLRSNGSVTLTPPRFASFVGFFLTPHWNFDFWLVLGVASGYVVLRTLPISFPSTLLLVIPGTLLIFYFPGHSFLKIFLRNHDASRLERYPIEVGTSILIVMIAGFLLNFSPVGFEPGYLIQAFVGLDISLAVIGSYVDFSKIRSQFG